MALGLARRLHAQGFLIPAIRYPTVARGEARLRVTVSAEHSLEDIERLGLALREARAEFPPGPEAEPA